MSSQCSFECFESPGSLESNADVGGPGVVIGFLGTAWFVVTLVILRYFLAFDPSQNPFQHLNTVRQTRATEDHIWIPNYVDQWVLSYSNFSNGRLFQPFNNSRAYKWLAQRSKSSWEKAFNKVILSMCDAQLLTGIGILLSGYLAASCFISAYHWQLIVYLAWFSNLTHMACLITMRSYFYQQQGERNWRLVLMTILWLGLIPAVVPTVFFNWANKGPTSAFPGSNARCFFDMHVALTLFNNTAYFDPWNDTRTNDNRHSISITQGISETSALQSAVISILILSFSYCTRFIKLVKSLSDGTRLKVRQTVGRFFLSKLALARLKLSHMPRASKKEIRRRRIRKYFVIRPLMSLYLVGKLYADLLTSDASDVYWLLVSSIWGTMRFTTAQFSTAVDDNEWGFGQILAVFLLIGPIIATIQCFATDDSIDQNISLLPNGLAFTNTVSSHGTNSITQPTSHPLSPDLQQPATTIATSPAGENITSPIQNTFNLADTTEETRELLQNYYTQSPWMPKVITLACLQVFSVTGVILSQATFNMNPVGVITNTVVNILVTQPLNCFCFILLSISIEHQRQRFPRKERKKVVYTTLLLVVLVFDITGLTSLPNGWDVFASTGFLYLYIYFTLLHIAGGNRKAK